MIVGNLISKIVRRTHNAASGEERAQVLAILPANNTNHDHALLLVISEDNKLKMWPIENVAVDSDALLIPLEAHAPMSIVDRIVDSAIDRTLEACDRPELKGYGVGTHSERVQLLKSSARADAWKLLQRAGFRP
jgi:hypothetical protein